MNHKSILITGGAGFIGSHIVDLLESKSVKYRIVDNLSGGSIDNIPVAVANGSFVQGDVNDYHLMEKLIAESSLILHLASVVGVKNVLTNPLGTIDTNINSLKYICEKCSENKIPLVFFSSSLVYPNVDGNNGFFSEEEEAHGLGFHPVSVYVSAKKIGELVCEYYKERYGLKYIILRPFNIIGIRQNGNSGMVVPSFVKSALTNKTINVYGTGQQTRSFSDVRLAVILLWDIIQNENSYGQIFNLATTDKSITILELARLVIKLLDKPVKINFIPMSAVYGEAYKDIENRSPSLAKLRQHLQYWEESDLRNILSEIINYELNKNYVNNKNIL
jgi:UDP-glucose 4-epimerase